MIHGPEWLDAYRFVILLIGIICLIAVFVNEMRRR